SATHSHDAGIAKAHAQHASHPSGADCDCCDGGKCDCTCMHAVSSIVISVASMLTSVPLHSRADARLTGAHAEPARARLIRPPTVHAA
ncbi:MAG: CopL family metal-binding regulatory protein, partial [Luteimonas sp.]